MKVLLVVSLLSLLTTTHCSALAVHKKHTMLQSDAAAAVPWSCPYRQRWLTLGNNYFPSRVPFVECLSSVCIEGHYTCKAVQYNVLVARTCGSRTCNDHRIPPRLRHVVELVSVPVNVSCICSD